MFDWMVGLCVWIAVAVGAVFGARLLDHAFRLLGDYSMGSRAYPDRDS